MPLQQSSLITRKQLACISGGKVNKKKCPNFLKLGTPFTYCGGRSYALKGNRVHHINVKEEKNLPFPDSNKEELIIHKIATKTYNGELPREIQAMKDTPHVVPIFLEPKDQSTKSGADTGKGLTYVGHWKVTNVLRRTKEKYKNQDICARVYFQFDRFDEEFSKYIEHAHDKPISELITMENVAYLETLGDSDDDHSQGNGDRSDEEEESIDTVEKSMSTTTNSTARSVSINPQESIEALESLEEVQEEEEQEASEVDDSDYDGSNDEESIDTVEKSMPATRTASRRSISVSITSQESPDVSELSEEAQEEMKQKEIKQEASDGSHSDNDNDDDAKSIDTVEKSVPTTQMSTSTSVSRNPQESPDASEVIEEAQEEIKQEEIKQEARDDYYSHNENGEKEESVDTVEESIPLHQVAVDVTHAATPVSRSVQKAPDTSESNLPDQEIICIDSSSDEEDAKQLSGEEDDDDSIIEEVTSVQPNLKREPDFEEEYFLVRCDGDTSDKMVHIAKKQKTTWLNIRNAVNSQIDPCCGSYNFHIPDRNLDICHRQELYEVKQYLKGGSGTFDDPYQKIVIKKSK